eukprot:2304530-Heterocapsa_arctica.AAC.1
MATDHCIPLHVTVCDCMQAGLGEELFRLVNIKRRKCLDVQNHSLVQAIMQARVAATNAHAKRKRPHSVAE